MELLILWLVLATVVAMIANSKGRSAVAWWFYGFLVWPIALVHILLKEKEPAHHASPTPPAYLHQTASPQMAAPDSSLDAETFKIAEEWRASGRTFTMLDAKEEARLRIAHATRRGQG